MPQDTHPQPHAAQDGIAIRHDAGAHRFVADVDGVEAYVEYEPEDGRIAITHTIVPEVVGGRGIAGRLVAATLEYARGAGLKVAPRCSYAEAYMGKHPEYADLRAGAER